MSRYISRNRRDGITSRFRLRDYDYSTPGYYFVTVCIEDRSHRLGQVRDDQFLANGAGQMVIDLWLHQPERFPDLEVDAFCVMPNHFHGLVGIGPRTELVSRSISLPAVMQSFKFATTIAYGKGVRELGWPRYRGHLWQMGYHEHIVRDDRDLHRIRTYIENNPANWIQDGFYTMS